MIPADFFVPVIRDGRSALMVDLPLLDTLRGGSVPDKKDVEVAVALSRLVEAEFETFSRNSDDRPPRLDNDEIHQALWTLRAVLRRLGYNLDLGFRDYTTFKDYKERREFSPFRSPPFSLNGLFEPVHEWLYVADDEVLASPLAGPEPQQFAVSWSKVDAEIRELQRLFSSATTPQDFKDVGNRCVGVLEALGDVVYDPVKHVRDGEIQLSRDKTKQRLGRYIEDSLVGQSSEEARGLAIKAIDLAQAVKHREAPSRRDAGVAGDAVVLLASICRRLRCQE